MKISAYQPKKARIEIIPLIDVIFVQTDEPSGPYGAKSVSELSIDGVAPAIASASATSVSGGESTTTTSQSF